MRRAAGPLTDRDRAMVAWFQVWLQWSNADPRTRGPEPADPDGNQPQAQADARNDQDQRDGDER